LEEAWGEWLADSLAARLAADRLGRPDFQSTEGAFFEGKGIQEREFGRSILLPVTWQP
jgi:hypothetical protein